MNTVTDKVIQPEIKIKEVSISNFRGFENLNLEFQPDLTVLIGENGAGKTAVLDCLASLLTLFQEYIQSHEHSKKLLKLSDIKQNQFYTISSILLSLGNQEVSWRIELNRSRNESNDCYHYVNSKLFEPIIRQLHDVTTDQVVNLPLVVYYPVNNSPVNTIDFKNATDYFATDIFSAYQGALDKTSFDFVNFFNWYKWQENIERQIGGNKTLDTVRNAIYGILSDESKQFKQLSIDWRNNPNGEMMIYKNHTPLNINQLSSGEKTLLALVADLARRLAIANPHRENPLIGNGVVLIDEVDLHLHPRWQRAVIPQLQKTFPHCQFIVTTHSPLVLSNIPHNQVIILEDFQAVKTTPHTFGRDNNSILYELMGVEQRPKEVQRQLDKVYELIEEGKRDAARTLLEELSKDLGENDVAIAQAYVSLDFMDSHHETN